MKTLLILTGPTGVGKTEFSLQLAEALGSPIISADSRQIYKELPIGTAAPTAEELARVKHYFIGTHSITDIYTAGQYERDVMQLTAELFRTHDTLLMTGGSMLYIDAVCNGLDDLPTIPPICHQTVETEYKKSGIVYLQEQLEQLDPEYYQRVDKQNPQRLMHAIEISLTAGKPYSTLLTGGKKDRPFRYIIVVLEREREQLYNRINKRVDIMLNAGLEEEARSVYPKRELNSLNTVGYKELFAYFDGKTTKDEAIRLIKQDTRHYAKRQLTWWRRRFETDRNVYRKQAEDITINKITRLL